MADERTQREIRDDARADRGDALADRMDNICDKLTDKIEGIAVAVAKVDLQLSNHLSHHEKFEKFILYPVIIAFVIGLAGLAWEIFLRPHLVINNIR